MKILQKWYKMEQTRRIDEVDGERSEPNNFGNVIKNVLFLLKLKKGFIQILL